MKSLPQTKNSANINLARPNNNLMGNLPNSNRTGGKQFSVRKTNVVVSNQKDPNKNFRLF